MAIYAFSKWRSAAILDFHKFEGISVSEPLSPTLTHISRSPTHFYAEKPETSNPYNFVIYDLILTKLRRMDPHMTPSW